MSTHGRKYFIHYSRLDFKYIYSLGILAGYTSANVINNYYSRKSTFPLLQFSLFPWLVKINKIISLQFSEIDKY